jgi:protein-histidine N-methyltransferase
MYTLYLVLLLLYEQLGCGTAVPTLLLLDHLFSFLASDTLPSDGGNGEGNDVPLPLQTEIHLQDYNRSVLELVTFPNILLAWCSYRSSAAYSPPFARSYT